MIVIGVDPGTSETATVMFNGLAVVAHEVFSNEETLSHIQNTNLTEVMGHRGVVMVIEQVESFGMAVGKEVFETVFWTGRFVQAWCPRRFDRMPRRIVKQHLCHTARATDANIRQALIDRFGAVGTKKAPGLLYGIKSHEWAALAVAVTWFDQHGHETGETIRSGIQAEF